MTLTKPVVILASLFAFLNITSGSIPSAPRNVNIDGIGSRSINISWTRPAQDGNITSLNYAVFYHRTGINHFQGLDVRGDTKTTISALKPYRRYDIYVMAGNRDGYGPTTKKNATTMEEEPEKCPKITYTAERPDPGKRDLEIGWDPVPEEYQNGIIKGYVIFYIGKSMTSFRNVTVNDSLTMYTFKNFSKEENYGFRVAAFTSVGLCKGYEDITWENEFPVKPTTAPITTAPITTAPITTAPITTAPITTAPITTASTQVKETTINSKEPTVGTTQTPSKGSATTEVPTPGETLARTSESNWLVYVLIALAVIVAIMGVTIFLLIWQLYKNHRFYKLRREQYGMTKSATPNMGADNEAQDNAV